MVNATTSVLPLGVNEGRSVGLRRCASIAGALVLFASSALAEVQGPPGPRDYRRSFRQEAPEVNLWKPAVIYGAANLADALSGVAGVKRGGVERNPMGDPWLVAGVSFVAEVLLDLAAQRWAPAWASRVLRGVAVVAYSVIGLHNHGAARELPGTR